MKWNEKKGKKNKMLTFWLTLRTYQALSERQGRFLGAWGGGSQSLLTELSKQNYSEERDGELD